MTRTIEIDGATVKPGENRMIELKVARLPSGTQIHLPIHIYNAEKSGPGLLLCGGLHGDEINGIEVVRRMVFNGLFEKLRSGTVIALPVINIYGFINFSREVPDGKDVNRSFPGNVDGSLASHVAHIITNQILPLIDYGIDFHTGGASRYNFPQIRYAPEDKNSERLAEVFATPFSVQSSLIENSLRWQALKMGKTMLVYEGGESLRFDEMAIAEAIRGVQKVMGYLRMLPSKPGLYSPTVKLNRNFWIRAPRAGMFRSLKKSGEGVNEGELIGLIYDLSDPREEIRVEAKEGGFIIGHNNMPVVNRGDALFNIGTK